MLALAAGLLADFVVSALGVFKASDGRLFVENTGAVVPSFAAGARWLTGTAMDLDLPSTGAAD
jgi:hypothetical protein